MAELGLPAVYAVLVWWFTTGAILFLALVAMMLFRVTLVLQGDRLQGRNRRLVPRFLLYLAGSLGLGLVLGAVALVALGARERRDVGLRASSASVPATPR